MFLFFFAFPVTHIFIFTIYNKNNKNPFFLKQQLYTSYLRQDDTLMWSAKFLILSTMTSENLDNLFINES